MATQLNFCSQCGGELTPGSRFCSSCGYDIASASGGTQATQHVERSLEDEIGDQLRESLAGEYDVAGLLGKGGMALVYRAHEMMLDREVAIKVLPPEMAFGSGMVERFKREAKTAAKLNHPNIIPIYRIGQLKGTVYFVMKYVSGKGLDDLLARLGKFDVEGTIAILDQVGSALNYAHRIDVIHRDIKPSNIMIDEDGWALVMDFGIAKAGGSSTLTATGAAIGTPHYMSPEQCTGKDVTVLSDQYSLGIMTYQMLTGTLPFEGDTLPEIISKHFFDEPPPLEERMPDCPPDLAAAVNRALAKKPEERFPALEDYVNALKECTEASSDKVRKRLATIVADAGLPGEELPPESPVPPSRIKDRADAPTTPMPSEGPARPSAPTTPMPAHKEELSTDAAAPTTPMPAQKDEAPTTPVPAAPSEPATSSPQEPASVAAAEKKSKIGLITGIAAVAVLAGAGGMYFGGVFGGGGEEASGELDEAGQFAQGPTGPEQAQPPGQSPPTEGAGGPEGAVAADDSAEAAGGDEDQPQTSPAAAREPEQQTPPPPQDGTVVIRGAPSGARVVVGGRRITNFRGTELPTGRHSVVITASGYDRFTTSVDIRAGRQSVIDASSMQRTPPPRQPEPEQPAVDPNAHPSCRAAPRIPAGQAGTTLALRIRDCVPGLTVRVNLRPNDDGLFEPRGNGRVLVILDADGYIAGRVDTTVTPGDTLVISGSLERRN